MEKDFLNFSFKNLILSIIIVIIVIILFLRIKISNKIKIIYLSLIIVFIFYLVNIDEYRKNRYNKNKENINKYTQKFYNEFETNQNKFLTPQNLGFIPVYYINLDRSTLRKNLLENEFKKYNITANRVSGIDGRKINGNIKGKSPNLKFGTINGISYYIENPNISTYELGCTLSHLKAISQAYNDGHKLALIFEDDIGLDLIPHWEKNLHQIIKEFPKDWTLVNLNSACPWYYDKLSSYKHRQCWMTTAYLINKKGMKHFLNMKQNGVFHLQKAKYGACKRDYSADCYLYSSIPYAYGYNHSLFYSRPFSSTIGSSDLMNSEASLKKIRNFIKKQKINGTWNSN